MPIKLGNNARAHLAAPLAIDGATIVLVADEAATFPVLSAGDWFPLTLTDPDGHIEIVRVTARSSNVLTATRAQELTNARAWLAGDRAEIRFTAGAFDALRTEMQAEIDATQTAIETATASNLATALSAALPVGFGPVPWSGPDEPAGWVFADGRTLTAASPYSALRAYYIAKSFPHGQDGSGNPKIPDARGRVPAGVDGGAARLTGATLGAVLGAETHTLTTAQLPSHAHTASTATGGSHSHGGSTDVEPDHAHTASTATGGSHSHTVGSVAANSSSTFAGQIAAGTWTSTNTTSTHAGHTHTVTVNAGGNHSHAITSDTHAGHSHAVTVDAAGSGAAHPNVQPTLVTNFIIKAT